MPVVINILLAIHIVVSLLIVLIVLMQRPKNEGLGAAFGGGMTDNLFGAQTTNVLQTITRWLGGLFFLLTLLLSILYVKQAATKSGVQKVLSDAPAVAPATPAPDLPSAASPPVQVTDTPSTAAPALEAVPPIPAPAPTEAPKPAAPPAPPADSSKPADPAAPPAEAPKPADAPAPAPAEPAKPQN
jgi:protein translocase SecG subunit